MTIGKALLSSILMLAAAPVAAQSVPNAWKEEWPRTEFQKRTITFDEILSGGPPKDGIPSIDVPKFATLDERTNLKDNEPVIGLAIENDARAYPLSVMTWHEIVNDTVGGTPVAVTYCPLCNSAIAFERRIDGAETTFGTTGKLRNSDLVMYDRLSETWWQQFTGEAIIGTHTGKKLKMIPVRLESFARFKERHPNGKVLIPNNPEFRDYGRNPYPSYDSSRRPFLFHGDLPKGIPAMARVVVVDRTDKPRAVALTVLREKKEMHLGNITLQWHAGQASALDASRIADGVDVGNVIAQRSCTDGANKDVPYDVTFAFVFHAFHPEGEMIKD